MGRFDLAVQAGDFLAVVGPNGGGKTTLLRAVLGQVPYEGKILHLDEQDKPFAQVRVGYVPPSAALNLGGEEHAPEPNKFMIYELHKVKGGDYYLYAIRDVEGAGMVPGAPDPVMPWQDELGQGSSAGDLLPETPGTSGDSGSSDDASSGGESAPEEEGEDTGDSGDSSAGEESEPSSSSAPMEG